MQNRTKWIITGGAAAFVLAPVAAFGLPALSQEPLAGSGYVAHAADPTAKPAPGEDTSKPTPPQTAKSSVSPKSAVTPPTPQTSATPETAQTAQTAQTADSPKTAQSPKTPQSPKTAQTANSAVSPASPKSAG